RPWRTRSRAWRSGSTSTKRRSVPSSAKRLTKQQAAAPATFAKLRVIHPDAHCELDHQTPFQLLVATVLSAQTTDVAVNHVAPKLFARWPDARALSTAPAADVAAVLREKLGMHNQ